MKFTDATIEEVNKALQSSWQAFEVYRNINLKTRAHFLRMIASDLQGLQEEIVQAGMKETNLEHGRLTGEFNRTVFQLNSYADACESGAWLDIRIDTADSNRTPAKPDLRKMLIPLGPVVVFGASNFPFAYSTAGGDTACALAAGCPVIIKAHPAHAETSELVAKAVKVAAQRCDLPSGIFIHLHGAGFEVGKALVQHPLTRAVGFTGSFEGGKALFDLANARKVPIPVFAEMGSVNPVFLLPGKLEEDVDNLAAAYAGSITLSAGQFCTNPGLLVGIKGDALDTFIEKLGKKMEQVQPAKMLHPGIAKNFTSKRDDAIKQKGVSVVAQTTFGYEPDESIPTLAQVEAAVYLKKPLLHKEIFGPYSLVVKCKNEEEMLQVAQQMEGQLTATLMATVDEALHHSKLIGALQQICGRFILNGVPTGVEVALAMHHGGPYPATTDSRFTSVGADGIKRFARPFAFQGLPNSLLPDELKDENPLKVWRTVNNKLTQEAITA